MLRDGKMVPRNSQLAAAWFTKAAAQGHRAAQYYLADMYDTGEGVPRDLFRSTALFAASAKHGYPEAQFAVGIAYEFGEGIARDRRAAIYWMDQAANQGDGRAHWFADWLSDPNTPHFKTEEQLGAYINGQVSAYYARQLPRQQMGSYQEYIDRRVQALRENVGSQAADACRFNGLCN